jgi:hypothetical protein
MEMPVVTEERPISQYFCAYCDFECEGWPPEAEAHEFHHPLYPKPHPTLAMECSAQCENDGCDLSDCVSIGNDYGECRNCGQAARVYIDPQKQSNGRITP